MNRTSVVSAVVSIVSLVASGLFIRPHSVNAAPIPVVSQWGAEKDSLQMSVHTDKQEYAVGDIVILKITIRNVNEASRGLIEYNPETDFKVTLTDAQGKPIPLTQWGRSLPAPPLAAPVSVFSRPLVQATDIIHTLILSRRFDLSERGRYLVTVIRPGVRKQDGSGTYQLISNVLPLFITEPSPEITRPEDVIMRP